MIKHYVYFMYEEFGRGYIGKHKIDLSKNPIPEEDGYWSSCLDPTFKPTNKEILGIFDTEEEAYAAEIFLQKAYRVAERSDFANGAYQTSTGFFYDRTGISHTQEAKNQISQTMKEVRKKPEVMQKYKGIFAGEKNPNYNKCKKYNWINIKTQQIELNACPNHIAKAYGVNVGMLSKVVKGEIKQAKGWKIMSCQSEAISQ